MIDPGSKLNELLTWFQTTKLGLRIMNSSGGFLIRPNSGRSGGTVQIGESGAEIDQLKVHGPIHTSQMNLQQPAAPNTVTVVAPVNASAYTLTLPVTPGKPGDIMTFGPDGCLTASTPPDYATLQRQLMDISNRLYYLHQQTCGFRRDFWKDQWQDGSITIPIEVHRQDLAPFVQIVAHDGKHHSAFSYTSPAGDVILTLDDNKPEEWFDGYVLIKRL